MTRPSRLCRCGLAAAVPCLLFVLASDCLASAFVRGAYYRLGDADPGAAAGAIGNNPTLDSFSDALNLARAGSPHYAADVPALGPADNKLSMSFANIGLGGPAFPARYGRDNPLPMVEQGIALEAWAKSGPTNLDVPSGPRNEIVAYNGDPAANGFGFFNHNDTFVARLGTTEHALGAADVGAWHHLAYVYSLGTSSYYYDGKLVATSTTDPAPVAATGGFWVGGQPSGDNILYGMNGWVDEVRYQTFNPIAAGAFEPTSFLIVPEPSATGLMLLLGACATLRRRAAGTSGR
jgi:hypothetical protein